MVRGCRAWQTTAWSLEGPSATAPDRRALWDDSKTTGLAVVLGSRSGGLYARDFDEFTSYTRWAEKYPELAQELPTSQTPRPGRHVFARSLGTCNTRRFVDGELRGEGAIIVLPPSLHLSGKRYGWAIDPFGELPVIDPSVLVGDVEQVSQERRSAIKSPKNDTSPTQYIQPMACINSDKRSLINRALVQTLPEKFGQRNRKIFEFARHLQAILGAEIDPETLRPFVKSWHRKALPKIRTKEFRRNVGRFPSRLGEHQTTRQRVS